MDSTDLQLAHGLRLRFGMASGEPSEQQLQAIKVDAWKILDSGRAPSYADWSQIVRRHCPTAGSTAYKGQDNSDIVALLRLARKP